MNYLKSVPFVLVPLFILSILVSVFYYFGIMSTSIYHVFQILVPVMSFLVGGVYLGKHSKEKGWLEGLKLGAIFIAVFFVISYLAFDTSLSFKGFIYYIIILFASMLGAMFGIRNVEKGN